MKIYIWLLVLMIVSGLFAKGTDQKIYLFYSTDLRGGIEKQEATYMNPNFPPVLGGGAAVQGIIKKYRAQAKKAGDIVLVLDGGNIFNGANALGTKSKGFAIVDYMNLVGYDGMVFGNNDFIAGKEGIVALARRAHFPVLASNVYEKGTNKIPAPILPYTIIKKDGLKIGLFGIVSKSAEQSDEPGAIKDIQFGAEVLAAREAIKALKAQQADIIIALAYLGLPYDAEEEYQLVKQMEIQNIAKNAYITTMDLARQVEGIDLLISGGFNRGYQQPWEDPVHHTLCFQNYAGGGNLGLTILNVDRDLKKISGYQLPAKEQGLLLLSEDEFWPDAETADSITNLKLKYAPDSDEIIGVTRTTLSRSTQGEAPLNNLMCDAILEATDVDFAFNNFSGLRRDLDIGPITPRDLAGVFPFGNKIVLISIKGILLKELVENTVVGSFAGLAIAGGQVVYKKQNPDGHKITEFVVKGELLDLNKTYKIATTSYLAEGNAGMNKLAFLPASRFEFTDILIRDAVAAYIKKHSPLNTGLDGRWQKQ